MPGGGDTAVSERMRALHPTLRVLVRSGYNDDETLRRGIAQGTFPLLLKPFTIDALARAVESALGASADLRTARVKCERSCQDGAL